jgi:hypothetical protein
VSCLASAEADVGSQLALQSMDIEHMQIIRASGKDNLLFSVISYKCFAMQTALSA